MWDDEPDPTAMFISPLSVNGNSIVVRVSPGDRAGSPAHVVLDPATECVTVENSAVTVADSIVEPLNVTREWKERTNTIVVSGQIASGDSGHTGRLSLWQPEWYFLDVFAGSLRRSGIDVQGTIVDTVTAGATELLRLSHRLDSVVAYMNKTSDNLSAENVLKVLSAEGRTTPGSAEGGVAILRRFMGSAGIDTLQTVQVDGSGESRYNLLSPDSMVRLLVAMHADTGTFPVFFNSLPIAGREGTLSGRMRGSPAESSLRAKTGTLAGVSCLSGYVRTSDGELLAFSIMMQGIPGSIRPYRLVQDRIGAFLSTISLQRL